jgi:hypothetical protein
MTGAEYKLLLQAFQMIKSRNDAAAMKRKLQEIDSAVQRVGGRLDEEVHVSLRAAFDHLATAAAASTPQLRNDELSHARSYFNRFAHSTPGQVVKGLDRTLTTDQLIALGHFGNHHYFVLHDDARQALIEVYRCVEKDPRVAVELFPPQLFSRDYEAALRSAEREQSAARARLKAVLGGTPEHPLMETPRDRNLRYAQAAGVVVAGLLATPISPTLGVGLITSSAVSLVKGRNLTPNREVAASGERQVAALGQGIGRLLGQLLDESRSRRESLEHRSGQAV